MVSAANPLAVQAGVEMLRRGGSAVDAAVAVQLMLGLVEPQSSGLGGGAFLIHYEAATGEVTVLNGREKAPAAATPQLFLDESGKPLPFRQAVWSGLSTGVPGIVSLLEQAHQRFGKLPWQALFEPAQTAADEGFEISPRMGGFLKMAQGFDGMPQVNQLFSQDGRALQTGDLFKNTAYGQTLRLLAREGARGFYTGDLAAAIVERTRQEPLGGSLTLQDMADYRAQWVDPICGSFQQHRVCVPPPPSSGVSLLQMLAILDQTDIASTGPEDPRGWLLMGEASRLMYADRDQYVADPDFITVPVAQMLAPAYVRQRAALIGDRAAASVAPGQLAVRAADHTHEVAGTSHFVVVDAQGNAASVTTTVESLFGSGRVVNGFVLNNQLTDFSLVPQIDGVAVANAVAAGKRPRSSMSPAMVLDGRGEFVATVGSPGGNSILAYNAKALVGLLAWRLSMKDAIELPNLIARGDQYSGEVSKFAPQVVSGLEQRGVQLQGGRGEGSGLHGIERRDGQLHGAADSRREGIVGRVAAP